MIRTFADRRTESLFLTGDAWGVPPDVVRRAARKLDTLHAASRLSDLAVPRGNRLTRFVGIEMVNMPSRSMTSGASAFGSRTEMRSRSNSATTTRGDVRVAIPNTGTRARRPTHPGEILREDFLPDYGLSVASLAEALGVSRQSVNELLRERRAMSPEMALRLAALFEMSPDFWLDLQRAVDLWDAAQTLKKELRAIQPLQVA